MLVVRRRLVTVALADGEEAGGRDLTGVLIRRSLSGQDVTGDLLPNKLVIRLVFVDCLDHPVAILHRLAHRIVRPIPCRVRVARHVQPVPAPALAIGRSCQQAVDQTVIRIGRSITQEIVNFFRRRRQPGQVKGRTTNQCPPVGLRIGLQPVLLQLVKHEPVQGLFAPAFAFQSWRRRGTNRLERPMLARGHHVHARCAGHRPHARISSPRLHPLLQRGNLSGRQGMLRRHLQITVRAADGLDEQAALDVTGLDHRPMITALLPACLRIQTQAVFLLLVAMTLLTLLDKQGTDLRFKKRRVISRRRSCRQPRKHKPEADSDDKMCRQVFHRRSHSRSNRQPFTPGGHLRAHRLFGLAFAAAAQRC